ncbi:hypothetical protein [Pseudomonas sp. AN-1]|uniref:hypothetical protein n=1 Tax=Pseudomonas sp. AN-1 TaxID=3096605 RepID=UPI002A6B0711|nr:hypothetical protein [Pseudomonas sp. AN-1]WPP44225.1 hypothetical protein SK095_13185 [Pseudomonas sp. AN-1]
MKEIIEGVEGVVALAESMDGFCSVEVSVVVRRSGGELVDRVFMSVDEDNGGLERKEISSQGGGGQPKVWF